MSSQERKDWFRCGTYGGETFDFKSDRCRTVQIIESGIFISADIGPELPFYIDDQYVDVVASIYTDTERGQDLLILKLTNELGAESYGCYVEEAGLSLIHI